jgi:hypothetical protein
MLPQKLPPDFQVMFAENFEGLLANGVPKDLERSITRCEFLFPATSFIDISQTCGEKLAAVV